MIQLNPDCLLFKMSTGDMIPCSSEIATVELMGDAAGMFDSDVIRSAAAAVLHYFRIELGRECVTVAEFSRALARVLREFGLNVKVPEETPKSDTTRVADSDLRHIASGCDKGFELAFFPRLRLELRDQLLGEPRVLRFNGLRGCVKQLVGVRRWNRKCQDLADQIVEFLRQCLTQEAPERNFALLVH